MVEALIIEETLKRQCAAVRGNLYNEGQGVEEKNLLVSKIIQQNGVGTYLYAEDKEKEVKSVQALDGKEDGTRVITLHVDMKAFTANSKTKTVDKQKAEAEQQKYATAIQDAEEAAIKQFKEMMKKSAEVSMQTILKVTGLTNSTLRFIYDDRLTNIAQYFKEKNKEDLISKNKTDGLKGLVEELTVLEYDTFRQTPQGKAAIKEGTIERSWMEYLTGEGGVRIYNSFAEAVGLTKINLAKDNFDQLKQEAKTAANDIIATNVLKNTHPIEETMIGMRPTIEAIRSITQESNLSPKAKNDLALEYLIGFNNTSHQGQSNSSSLSKLIDHLENIGAQNLLRGHLVEGMRELRTICQEGGIIPAEKVNSVEKPKTFAEQEQARRESHSHNPGSGLRL